MFILWNCWKNSVICINYFISAAVKVTVSDKFGWMWENVLFPGLRHYPEIYILGTVKRITLHIWSLATDLNMAHTEYKAEMIHAAP
jgi:hypothetical protein